MRLPTLVAVLALAACTTADPELATESSALVDPSAFTLPSLSAVDRATIVHKYDALDPTNLIPRGLLEDAMIYFDVNQALIPQTHYFVVVDLSQYSGHSRFWLVDLTTGAVEAHKVAHGAGSDPNNDGYATLFSNVSGSNQSSLGFYLTGELYDGTHPHSMRIDGLSPDGSPNGMADTNVRSRLVVVHEATYVSDTNSSQQGRSDGCFALDPAVELGVVNRIHDGTLMYAAISPLASPVGRGNGTSTCGNGTCDPTETSASCPEDCGGCAPIATTATVDNGDACFVAGGPAAGLRTVTTAGFGGSLVWTHATAQPTEQNFAEWDLDFAQAGRYRVEAYTAAAFAQSKQASYHVLAGTTDHTVPLDQTALDGYQSLGEFDFAQGAHQHVHLGDNTGEPPGTVQLVFDAVRVTLVNSGSGTGPADGQGSGSDPTDSTQPGSGCSTTSGNSAGFAVVLVGLVLARRRRLG